MRKEQEQINGRANIFTFIDKRSFSIYIATEITYDVSRYSEENTKIRDNFVAKSLENLIKTNDKYNLGLELKEFDPKKDRFNSDSPIVDKSIFNTTVLWYNKVYDIICKVEGFNFIKANGEFDYKSANIALKRCCDLVYKMIIDYSLNNNNEKNKE